MKWRIFKAREEVHAALIREGLAVEVENDVAAEMPVGVE